MKREWLLILLVVGMFGIWTLYLKTDAVALIAIMSLGSGFVFMGYVIYSGITLKRVRRGEAEDSQALDVHRGNISVLTIFILVGVLCIEIVVRREGALWGPLWLKSLHFMFVGSMLLSYLNARFRFTGLMNPQYHRRNVYLFVMTYAATLVTGSFLLFERFPLSLPSGN